MLIHITRHGQPAIGGLAPGQDHEFPPGDPVLTELGRRQATWLGHHLAEFGFHGTIFSSPYRRTLETASLIALETASVIVPEAAIQECVFCDGYPEFDGLNAEEMQQFYPAVAASSTFCHPWFVQGPESFEKVTERVRPFVEWLQTTSHDQVLLVGHGASVHGMIKALRPEHEPTEKPTTHFNWNCSLTTFEVTDGQMPVLRHLFDVAHIPLESVSSNLSYRAALKA